MDWFHNEMIDGLTKLMSLSLDRTPAADSVQITAATWIEATTTGRVWDQARDASRIRAAFSTLYSTSEKWPAPRHFLDALPRVEVRALDYEVKPASREDAQAAMARIREMLGESVPAFKHPVEPTNRTLPEDREAIERELRQHYQRDGKAAAAGDS
jgi:hypothetical protein